MQFVYMISSTIKQNKNKKKRRGRVVLLHKGIVIKGVNYCIMLNDLLYVKRIFNVCNKRGEVDTGI